MKKLIIFIFALLLFSRAITAQGLSLGASLSEQPFTQGYSVYAEDDREDKRDEEDEDDEDDDDHVKPTRVPTKEPTSVPVIIVSPIPTNPPIPPILATIDNSSNSTQQDINNPSQQVDTSEIILAEASATEEILPLDATPIPTELLAKYIVEDLNANGIVDSWE